MLANKGEEMGFNGYLNFLLVRKYVDSKFPTADDGARMSAVHYLLANMGYDVRLAISQNGIPLIMLPFDQIVYGSVYLAVDGKNYTVFAPEGKEASVAMGGKIYTCQLPQGEELGKSMDLRINGLRIPYKPFHYHLEGGGITLDGELNENLFGILYRYPQMPTEDFASSVLDPAVRESVVSQVRSQLNGSDDRAGVDALLSFFHEALPYATDEQRHGFEKPYFLEETLFYDKCDCEDRAIMFTYLLWNALGLENHLVAYPMHESAAVKLTNQPSSGYSYTYGGNVFWSADPTYLGSHAGDVMPQFNNTAPKIDKAYGR